MEPSLSPLPHTPPQNTIARRLLGFATPGEDTRALPWVLRLVRSMAVQDWLVTGYFIILLTAVITGAGPLRTHCIVAVVRSAAVVFTGIVLARGSLLPWGSKITAIAYRLMLMGPVLQSYFLLRDVLPTATPRSLDAQLYAFDLRVFGFEPSVVLDRFVNPLTVEWFSFFYFGYFVLISLYTEGSLFFAKDTDRLAAFTLGLLTIVCVGHCSYMLVPGFGPYRHLSHLFAHRLEGPLFWRLVWDTVTTAGAMKDIFPSLHTAMPSFMALFAWRNRHVAPFKYVWIPTAMFTSQIIIATLFLRWHYFIDVVVGFALAMFCAFVLPRVAAWEKRRREAMDVMPVWAPMFTLPFFRDGGR